MESRAARATELYQMGREAWQAHYLTDAIAFLRASAALAPHYKTYELLGEVLIEIKQYASAAKYLAASAGLAPRQTRARVLLANALSELGDNRGARAQLTEALRIDPNYRTARDMLGRLPAEEDELASPQSESNA